MSATASTPATHTTRPRSRARRIATRLTLAGAALLLVLYLGIAAVAANLLTVPRRAVGSITPAAYQLAFQDVEFPARDDRVPIAGWFIPNAASRRAVVLVHGWNSSRSAEFQGRFVEFAAALQRRGFAVLLVDLRGHGASGDAHFSFGLTERRDLIGAVDWLEQQGFQPGSIGLLGVSMGAATSIGAAAGDPAVGALVADCSFAEIKPLIEREWSNNTPLPQFFLPGTVLMGRLLYGYTLWDARPVEEVDEIAPRPLLIIHGDADTFTPLAHGQALRAAAPTAEYWEVAGAAHAGSYRTDPAAYVERVASFFERSLH